MGEGFRGAKFVILVFPQTFANLFQTQQKSQEPQLNINFFPNLLGIHILKKTSFDQLTEKSNPDNLIDEKFFYAMRQFGNLDKLSFSMEKSESQLKQDLFVLSVLRFKDKGYFVEFGATDGKTLSNTYLLEKNFEWTGILAEPGKTWHKRLKLERNSIIDNRCVWSISGENLSFIEANYAEVSTLAGFAEQDGHSDARKNSLNYKVQTVSLNDLLEEHGAPEVIDYLSIDTEGSEFEILSTFNFNKYKFRVITCEHNFGETRSQINELLKENGYTHVFSDLSRWDDWYVHEELVELNP